MEDYDHLKLLKILQENNSIVEKQEPSSDISIQWINKNEDLQSLEEGIPLVNFSETISKRNKEMEFRVIRRITETQLHNTNLEEYHPDKSKHNRYGNIIPFKQSIVSVPSFEFETNIDDITSTYINANFINTSLNDQNRIIATQGPLFPSFANFWKMINHKNVDLIIMLCQLKENNKAQCDLYWPHKELGDFYEYPKKAEVKELKVTWLDEKKDNELFERKFFVESQKDGKWEGKPVSQLQWINWPDHSVPKESDFFMVKKLIDRMLAVYIDGNDKKIVVHCSAGVGRTGTLIALFNLTLIIHKYVNELKKENEDEKLNKLEIENKFKISIFGVVRRLREQRWGMVHTSEQYLYLYKYCSKLIDYLLDKY